jgi:hypothetical protein
MSNKVDINLGDSLIAVIIGVRAAPMRRDSNPSHSSSFLYVRHQPAEISLT